MSLADQIIEHGPVESHDPVPRWFEQLTAAGINALRDELIELRRLRAAAEARQRFELEIDRWTDPSELDLTHDCPRWGFSSSSSMTLAELVRRADEHGKECG